MERQQPGDAPAWAVNLLDPDARTDPFPMYAAMRRDGAVGWNRRMGFWMVVGYAAAKRVLSDHERFSSRIRQRQERSLYGAPTMIFTDPPRHTELRQVVASTFTADAARGIESMIRRITIEQLDRALARGAFDFVAEVSGPLPVMAVGELLGIPPGDRPFLKEASDAVVSIGVAGGSTARGRHAAADRLREYFAALLRRRLASGPVGDLLDDVCAAYPSPTPEQLREMVAACMLVLVAGHETTTALLGNAVLGLVERPRVWELLAGEPRLLGAAIEEMIRLDGPVHALRRWTTRRIDDLGGVALAADSPVVVLVAAANRDPDRFDRPDEFLIERGAAPAHLGFGWGAHYCLGARIARIEARLVLGELLGRANVRLAVPRQEIPYVPSLFVRGPASLPLLVT